MKQVKIIDFFKNLDALRGIACMLVFFFHLPTYLIINTSSLKYRLISVLFSFNGAGGKLGVFFFFVLSGFLITYLLLKEKYLNNYIDLKNFYLRRIFRIWPLYFLVFIIGFWVSPYIASGLGKPYVELANPIYYLFFISNFEIMTGTLPVNKVLGTFWSISVEEQFYLVWPLLFITFSSKNLIKVLVVVLMIAITFIAYYSDLTKILYYHTLSSSLYLAVGSIGGYFVFYYQQAIVHFFNTTTTNYNALIYIGSLLILFFYNDLSSLLGVKVFVLKFFTAIFFLYIILDQVFNKKGLKLGNFRLLNFLGKLSYSIYLTHILAIYIILYLTEALSFGWVSQILFTIIFTVILAFLCYKWVELPFIKIKKKYRK